MPTRNWRDLFGFRRKPKKRRYDWNEEIHGLLEDLLRTNQADRQTRQELWQYWDALTLREQQVVAFICLGYTNRQIAARLGLSIETVKTHVKNVLLKLRVHSKTELRVMFSSGDFSEWNH
jgi:DNA-binding CsgD family transcriptional regulator